MRGLILSRTLERFILIAVVPLIGLVFGHYQITLAVAIGVALWRGWQHEQQDRCVVCSHQVWRQKNNIFWNSWPPDHCRKCGALFADQKR
jgi:hypothetical protein